MNDDWNSLVNNLCNRKIVVFGTGNAGSRLADILLRKGFQIDVFFDNDLNKQGGIFKGSPVIEPQKLEENTAYIVAIENNNVSMQLVDQLTQLLINEKDIFVFNKSTYIDFVNGASKDDIEFELSKNCKSIFGESFDIYNPHTYNEIINWEKTNVHDERRTRLADKVAVRDWVAEKIGQEYLNKVYYVFENEDEIDFKKLPERYVLKFNNYSNRNIFVKDSSKIDEKEIIKTLKEWRNTEFAYLTFEMHYKDIKPKIICEEFIEGIAEELYDYNIYCFHGEPEYIWCIKGSHKEWCQASFYNKNWEMQEFSYGYPKDPILAPRPKQLEEMLALSRKLSAEFEHVRVDWYILPSGEIRFGEMTFSSWAGMKKFEPEKYDRVFGNLIRGTEVQMNKSLISVIMPTYNRGYVIQKAIQSVIDQTYHNWELIIVDDASTDDTEALIKEIKDFRVKYVKNEENKGANYSRNRGCALAKGEYLAFLDSDNYWVSDKLEKQITILENSKENVALVFCSVEFIVEKMIVPDINFDVSKLKEILCKRSVIDTNGILMRRKIFNDVGGFDERFPRSQDWELTIRTIVAYKYAAVHINEVLDYNITQPNSISKDNDALQESMLMLLEKYWNCLEIEDILSHMRFYFRNAANTTSQQRCQELLQKKIEQLEPQNTARVLLHELLYSKTLDRYYSTLFSWKEQMENSIKRTIFTDFLKPDQPIIALYGLGRWGEAIYAEMKNCGIKISYGIDQKVKEFHGLTIVNLHEIPQNVEVIIVSLFQQYQEIYDAIRPYYKGKIVSIKDIIAGIDS